MNGLLTGLVTVLVFGGVVLVHELGHFLAARRCGIHVEEFSIGIGPALWSRVKNGTRYSVRLLPLGGYNLFTPLDEDEDADAEDAERPQPKAELRPVLAYSGDAAFPAVLDGQDFEQASAWQRFFVTLSGAAMNFLLGFVVLLVVVCSQTVMGGTTVADFQAGAKSAATGLQVGDTILQVDGKTCRSMKSLLLRFDGSEATHRMVVLRDGEVVELPAVTVVGTVDENGVPMSATDFLVARVRKTPYRVLAETVDLFGYYSGAILGSFGQMVTGKVGVEELSGPVGVASAVSAAVQFGWREVLSLMALLTINLGIFNLLPVPALDGFKLLFLAIEGLTGYEVPPKVQGAINLAGMAMLMGLMILVTMQDIGRLL